MPGDLHIEGGKLKWSREGSSAKVPGKVEYGMPLDADQKKALLAAGVPEIKNED